MEIKVLGAESLGVRGLSCYVKIRDRKVVIDPGVALGYKRHGLLPHPFQVATGKVVRKNILQAVELSTDLVISHFHGDHVPLPDAILISLHLIGWWISSRGKRSGRRTGQNWTGKA